MANNFFYQVGKSKSHCLNNSFGHLKKLCLCFSPQSKKICEENMSHCDFNKYHTMDLPRITKKICERNKAFPQLFIKLLLENGYEIISNY